MCPVKSHNNKNSENNDWKDEIDAIRKICHENGIDALIERSRSGNGAFSLRICTCLSC